MSVHEQCLNDALSSDVISLLSSFLAQAVGCCISLTRSNGSHLNGNIVSLGAASAAVVISQGFVHRRSL